MAFYRSNLRDGELINRNTYIHNATFNSLYLAVLEYCKLFGGTSERHYWVRLVRSGESETELLARVGVEERAFRDNLGKMRMFRDKNIAHQDTFDRLTIPFLDIPKTMIFWLFNYLVAELGEEGNQYYGFTPEQFYTECLRVGSEAVE